MELSLQVLSGAGNRFALLEASVAPEGDLADLARLVCDPGSGPGADGLIRYGLEDEGQLRFELWNADGSRAEVSGNGLRCCARAALDAGLVSAPAFSIRSGAGLHQVRIDPSGIWTGMGEVTREGSVVLPDGSAGELAVGLGLVTFPVAVRNPGGTLVVDRGEDGGLVLGGPVEDHGVAKVVWPA